MAILYRKGSDYAATSSPAFGVLPCCHEHLGLLFFQIHNDKKGFYGVGVEHTVLQLLDLTDCLLLYLSVASAMTCSCFFVMVI